MLKKCYPIFVLIVILSLLPLGLKSSFMVHTMIIILLNAYYAVSWNILGGFTGHFSLGNGAYIAIGGYVTGLLYTYNGITPWLGIIIGGVIAGLISLVISYPCFRLRGSYYTLSTMALLQVINIIVMSQPIILGYDTGGSRGMSVPWNGSFWAMQFVSKVPYYYIIVVLLFILMLASTYIKNSKTGYYFTAICTNQEAAASLGVPVLGYKLRAQFISAFFSALGGGFYCMFFTYLDPSRLLGASFSIEIMLLAVVGGMGQVWGPIAGAFIMVPISEYLRGALPTQLSGLPSVIYGAILMLVIFFLPTGLLDPIVKWVKKLWQKAFKNRKQESEVSV